MGSKGKEAELAALDARELSACIAKCDLHRTASRPVPGDGNADADIMFIGEAPGAREDELGKPFVGASGKFLDELIASIGLRRDDVYIANVIKHRPPANRDPLPEEIEAYRPWLEGQIRIIDPKVIVTLGRFSMEFILGPGLSISGVHGTPHERDGRSVIPMYHPAAALYRGDLRSVLAADFAKLPAILTKLRTSGSEAA